MKLFEWESADFTGHHSLQANFVSYLDDVWRIRNKYVEKVDSEEEQDQRTDRQRFFTFTGDGKIIARNYVGAVQFDNIRIEVYPKIFSGLGRNYPQYQLNLLYWLSYCRKIKFPFSLVDLTKITFDDYLELIIYVFANYTNETLAQQPFQAYQDVAEETNYLRGRLNFDTYVRNNVITGKWQHFHCTHGPFIYDNLFNRIVKFVASRLLNVTRHTLNRERLTSILFLLHDVSDISVMASDCDKVRLNPLFSDHRNVLNLCRLILDNQMVDTRTDFNQNFCFMIPMEYVFEDFVFGFIAEHWPTLPFRSQSTDYLALTSEVEVFQIKNDLYLKNQLIVDTKYKFRAADNHLKAGVSQGDLYQMIAYSIRRECRETLLLYPKMEHADNSSASFVIPEGDLSSELNVEVRSLDITFTDPASADQVIKSRFPKVSPVFQDSYNEK